MQSFLASCKPAYRLDANTVSDFRHEYVIFIVFKLQNSKLNAINRSNSVSKLQNAIQGRSQDFSVGAGILVMLRN